MGLNASSHQRRCKSSGSQRHTNVHMQPDIRSSSLQVGGVLARAHRLLYGKQTHSPAHAHHYLDAKQVQMQCCDGHMVTASLHHCRDSAMKAAQNEVKSGPSSPRSPSPPVGNRRAVLYSARKSFGETPPLKVKIECDSARVSLCPCFYPLLFCLPHFVFTISVVLTTAFFPPFFCFFFKSHPLSINLIPPYDTNVSICCF